MSLPMDFGKYRLLKRIGEGGMAEVFLAEASQARGLSRRCIIKRILPHLSGKDEFSRALIDEARISTTLSHPNLVSTYEFGEIDGRLYLALEYVDGPDLHVLMDALAKEGRRLPLDAALTILSSVLLGLHHAHDAASESGAPLGIVHRDVNPPNILISKDGAVKVADFGIASAAARLTRTHFGQLKGKIPYMSPEQADGRRLDRRSDLFSCGVVLYEMLTGARLFVGTSEFEVLRQVREAAVSPPSRFRKDVPQELDALCIKCLQRDRDLRFSDAAQMVRAVETIRQQIGVGDGAGRLARLVEELKPHWVQKRRSPSKTSVLTDRPGRRPEMETPNSESEPIEEKTKSRFGKKGIGTGLVFILCAICAGAAYFMAGRVNPMNAPEKPATQAGTFLQVIGGDGAFVILDDRLLGRAPLRCPISTERKSQRVSVERAGLATKSSGATITPGKTKVFNVQRFLRRQTGILVVDPSLQFLTVDHEKIPVDNGREQRAIFLAPGQVLHLMK